MSYTRYAVPRPKPIVVPRSRFTLPTLPVSGPDVRGLDGVNDNIRFPFANINGPITYAALIERDTNADFQGILAGYDSSNVFRHGMMLLSSGAGNYLAFANASTSSENTIAVIPADGWVLIAASHPGGTGTGRVHARKLASGSWQHFEGGTSIAIATTGASGTLRVGQAADNGFFFPGKIAVAGVWSVELSDLEVEALFTGLETAAWPDVQPSALEFLADFNQSNVGTSIPDLSDNGRNQSAITGTVVVSGDAPPSWTFGLPVPFDPSSLSGLRFWMKADDMGAFADGDPVGTWPDRSSQAAAITAAGSARPTYQTNELNNLPIVRFDGTDDMMTGPAWSTVESVSQGIHTIIAVAKVTGADAEVTPDYNNGVIIGDSNGNRGILVSDSSGTLRIRGFIWAGGAAKVTGNVGVAYGTWNILSQDNDNVTIRISANGQAPVTAASAGAASGTNVQLGKNYTATNFTAYDLAEILVYNRVLTDTERGDVEAYLQSKWLAADTTEPILNLTSASSFKMSDESTKDSYSYSFSVNEDIQAWKAKVVADAGDPHSSGTQVEAGGAVDAGDPVVGSITYTELVAAGLGSEGSKVLKFFAQDLAGLWSE